MAGRTKSKVTPKFKTKYRVNNWPAYEAALRKRGDHAVWFDEDAINRWNASPSGCPGGQRRYSDLAIACALTLRTVFQLPLRQAEGFLRSLIRLMGLELKTPDHTTLTQGALATQWHGRCPGFRSTAGRSRPPRHRLDRGGYSREVDRSFQAKPIGHSRRSRSPSRSVATLFRLLVLLPFAASLVHGSG
jgi:hypothetical protein